MNWKIFAAAFAFKFFIKKSLASNSLLSPDNSNENENEKNETIVSVNRIETVDSVPLYSLRFPLGDQITSLRDPFQATENLSSANNDLSTIEFSNANVMSTCFEALHDFKSSNIKSFVLSEGLVAFLTKLNESDRIDLSTALNQVGLKMHILESDIDRKIKQKIIIVKVDNGKSDSIEGPSDSEKIVSLDLFMFLGPIPNGGNSINESFRSSDADESESGEVVDYSSNTSQFLICDIKPSSQSGNFANISSTVKRFLFSRNEVELLQKGLKKFDLDAFFASRASIPKLLGNGIGSFRKSEIIAENESGINAGGIKETREFKKHGIFVISTTSTSDTASANTSTSTVDSNNSKSNNTVFRSDNQDEVNIDESYDEADEVNSDESYDEADEVDSDESNDEEDEAETHSEADQTQSNSSDDFNLSDQSQSNQNNSSNENLSDQSQSNQNNSNNENLSDQSQSNQNNSNNENLTDQSQSNQNDSNDENLTDKSQSDQNNSNCENLTDKSQSNQNNSNGENLTDKSQSNNQNNSNGENLSDKSQSSQNDSNGENITDQSQSSQHKSNGENSTDKPQSNQNNSQISSDEISSSDQSQKAGEKNSEKKSRSQENENQDPNTLISAKKTEQVVVVLSDKEVVSPPSDAGNVSDSQTENISSFNWTAAVVGTSFLLLATAVGFIVYKFFILKANGIHQSTDL